jgi:hypothetical protein
MFSRADDRTQPIGGEGVPRTIRGTGRIFIRVRPVTGEAIPEPATSRIPGITERISNSFWDSTIREIAAQTKITLPALPKSLAFQGSL